MRIIGLRELMTHVVGFASLLLLAVFLVWKVVKRGPNMRIMLDTMIYDLIVATPGMTDRLNQLSREGKVILLCTHIQEDQLANIPDQKKRSAVAAIVRKKVSTSGAVYGASKYGQATYGDGSPGGVSISDVRSPSGKHAPDALIATTAAQHADVLVTEDNRLANRMRSLPSPCQIWGFGELKQYVFQ